MRRVIYFFYVFLTLSILGQEQQQRKPQTNTQPNPNLNPNPTPQEQNQKQEEKQEQEQAITCGPRIRKSWDALTPMEKDIYLQAIELSMDNGFYNKFIEIHTDRFSTAEAHRTCMFVYWHRLLLLGYENMLRSYDGAFSCITIPYWDYVTHNANFLAGNCRNIEECSPILQDMGGSRRGIGRNVLINGTPISGFRCVMEAPLNHFCETPDGRPPCANCVPRGNWLTSNFPPTTSISSIMRQLFSASTIEEVANNIETGVHNTIHNSLDGTMGNLVAPADPIFFSHHATLDLLHSIYYKCFVGDGPSESIEERLSDPRQTMTCPRRIPIARQDRNSLNPGAIVTMQSGGAISGTPIVSPFDPQSVLFPFFNDLPREYLAYTDLRDIGPFSYNYELSGILAELYTQCQSFGSPILRGERRLEMTNANASSSPYHVNAVIKESLEEDVKIASNEWFTQALAKALESVDQKVKNDQDRLGRALKEVEKMTCMYYEECRGKIRDFSASFRQNFHIKGSTPCRQIVDDIQSGNDSIQVPDWKNILYQHLDCNAVSV